MIACWRWVMSACAVSSVLLVKNGWCRQTGNSSSVLARSRTRRTISRAVTGVLVEANAVKVGLGDLGVADQLRRCPGRSPRPGSAPASTRRRGCAAIAAATAGFLIEDDGEPHAGLEAGGDHGAVAVGASRRGPGSRRRRRRRGRCGSPRRPSTPRPCRSRPSRRAAGSRRSPAHRASVLIVVTSGDRPRRSTCLPAILVCPKLAPCLPCPNTGRSSESMSMNARCSIPGSRPVCSTRLTRCARSHRRQLQRVAVGELAQELPQRRRRVDAGEQPLHPTGADHVQVVDAVRPGTPSRR